MWPSAPAARALSALLLVGCYNNSLTPAAGGAGPADASRAADASPPSDGSTAPSDASAPADLYVLPSICNGAEPTAPRTFASFDEARTALTRVWRRCTTADRNIVYHPGLRGLELTADGQWFALDDDGRGGLLRRTGFRTQGVFQFVDESLGPPSGPVALQLLVGSDGQFPAHVSLSPSGTTLFLDSFDVADTFVATSELPTVLPPSAPAGTRAGAAGCGLVPSGIHSFFTPPDGVRQRLVGRWAICRDPADPMYVAPLDADGVEFTAAGEWFALRRGAGDVYVRATDPAHSGRMVFDGNVQVNLLVEGGLQLLTHPIFSDFPVGLALATDAPSSLPRYSALP